MHAETKAGPSPRVCILTLEPVQLGGVNVHVHAVYRMLRSWGWEPTIVYALNAGPEASLLERLRFTIKNWRAAPRPYPHGKDPFADLQTLVVAAPPVPFWLYYAVPQFIFGRLLPSFDVIVVVPASAHCAFPLALRGLPYVLWVATDYEDELRSRAAMQDPWAQATLDAWSWPLLVAQERYALRRAGAIVAWPNGKERLGEHFPDLADRMEPILFPVDTGRFKPAEGDPPQHPYGKFLLMTARIHDPRKNFPLMLEAFARVRAQRSDINLVTIGGHPSEEALEQRRRLGLEDSVYFVERWLSRDELIAHYQSAELFVLSSVQEGLGIPVLEAIACGLPVVSTDCGGPNSVVVEGQTGLLVPNHDPDALADGILRLLADPQGLDQLRANCVSFAARHFSIEVVEAQFKKALRTVYGRNLDR